MKLLITISLLFATFITFAQTPCGTDTPISLLDEPPGCYLNNFPFVTNNFDATPESTPFDFACGEIENSTWFSVLADSEGEIKMLIDGDYCLDFRSGFEVGLYDLNLNRIGGCSSTAGISPCLTVQYQFLTPGEVYLMMVDGYEGAQCKFTLRKQGIASGNFAIQYLNSNPPNTVCPGAEICYTIQDIPKVEEYRWSVNPNATILPSSNSRIFCVKFKDDWQYRVQLRLQFSCGESEVIEVSQRVSQLTIEERDTLKICEGLKVQINSNELNQTGIYSFFFENAGEYNCDSVYNLNFTVVDTSAPKIKCFKDTFINRIGIEWDKNPDVERYELQINDTLIHLNDRFTYMLPSGTPDNVLNIKLSPYSDMCIHASATAECINGRTVSTKTQSKQNFVKTSPNPTYSLVEIKSEVPIKKVQVFDAHGRLILNTKDSKINLEGEPAGVYFFKIETLDGLVLRKIIKI